VSPTRPGRPGPDGLPGDGKASCAHPGGYDYVRGRIRPPYRVQARVQYGSRAATMLSQPLLDSHMIFAARGERSGLRDGTSPCLDRHSLGHANVRGEIVESARREAWGWTEERPRCLVKD
jgi:hypothetical protein